MSYRTAKLQILHFIYYSTNTSTEYFKHAAKSPFFSFQNAVYFIMLPFLVPVLFTFHIQSVLKCSKTAALRPTLFQQTAGLLLINENEELVQMKLRLYLNKPSSQLRFLLVLKYLLQHVSAGLAILRLK